jgi:hypothetical protein
MHGTVAAEDTLGWETLLEEYFFPISCGPPPRRVTVRWPTGLTGL